MDSAEENLKLWRDRILSNVKRKELSPGEISSLFQNSELQAAFFKIMDQDKNGNLSQDEWTGSFLKLLGNEDDHYLINWFIEQFVAICSRNESEYLTLEQFAEITSDNEFGYRFSALIAPKARRVSALQLITSLEIIASCSTDSKWLKWLKYQFTSAMTEQNRMDKNELHVTLDDFVNNFYFKEPFLAHRLFNYLDKDKSGFLSLHEFINGLEVVVNGTQEQKFEFLFKVFDMDGNGRLNFQEMRMMLKCCLENLPSLDKNETIEELSVALFQDIDKDSSGDITLDELKDAFRRHTGIYNSLTVSTSIWIKPKFISKNNNKMRHLYRMKEKVTNNRAFFTFWSVYGLISVLCAATAYASYSEENIWVIVARIFGNNLNFNCSLILFLVCRKHATWMRSKGANMIVPIDEFIEIHKKIGVIILIESILHTVTHLVNMYIVCEAKKYNYWTVLFTNFLNIGYPTGVLLMVLLVVILVFAMPIVRKSGHFQVFFCFHLLTLPWLAISLIHGKSFWKWLLFPAICYTIEGILRFRKTRSDKFGDTFISEMIILPSKVIHLVIRKPPKFHYRPGDYIFINIPMIAKYEWHPFSISSAPERSDYMWLHIRCAGNWTRKLYTFASTYALDKNKSASSAEPTADGRRPTIVSERKKSHMVQINFGPESKDPGQVNIDLEEEEEGRAFLHKKQSKSVVRFKSSPNVESYAQAEYPNDTVMAFDTNQQATTGKDDSVDVNLEGMYDSQVTTPGEQEEAVVNQSRMSKVEGSVLIDAETGLELLKPSPSKLVKAAEAAEHECQDQHEKGKELVAQSSCDLMGEHDDELGYLKMYKRSNRICLGNMGLDECWRLKISIDGPYGTSSQAIFDSEHAVLIAAGIGITPFASVLQSMMNRFSRMNAKCRKCQTPISQNVLWNTDEEITIKKVDFIWVTRDQRSLEWFISLLSRMEIEQRKHNQNFLETHLYVTSAKRQSDMKTINLHLTLDAIFSQEESSLIDGLRQRSHSGRPNWDIVFQNIIRKQRGKIDVFYCGPPNLGEILEDKCHDYKLVFKKEFF